MDAITPSGVNAAPDILLLYWRLASAYYSLIMNIGSSEKQLVPTAVLGGVLSRVYLQLG